MNNIRLEHDQEQRRIDSRIPLVGCEGYAPKIPKFISWATGYPGGDLVVDGVRLGTGDGYTFHYADEQLGT